MKLLHKLLGVSDYIEQLEDTLFDKDHYYSNRLIEQKEINNVLNKERNELLSTKSRLTAEVLKLREEINKLNNQLIRAEDNFNEFKNEISEAATNLMCQLNKDYD